MGRAQGSGRAKGHRRAVVADALVVAAELAQVALCRQRLGQLAVLTDAGPEVDASGHVFATATGVELDERTRRAAVAHAAAEGLEVVDLVPADLPADRALALAWAIDPARFRADRFAPLRSGGGHALLLSPSVAERARVADGDVLDAEAFAALSLDAKRCASATCDLAVSPWLRALPDDVERRAVLFHATYGDLARPAALLRGAWTARTAVRAVARREPWSLAALAAHTAAPYLALAGGPLRPRDLATLPVRRLPTAVASSVRALARRGDPGARDRAARDQAEYAALVAGGLDRFFEPRRPDCPLCGSTDLAVKVTTPDFLQGKPGTFTLESCGACGHVFQNPRLTIEGLDYYYKDFWDGGGYELTETVLPFLAENYRARARMVGAVARPARWLDVGAGHGHFGMVARDVLPGVTWDGLDMTESIDEAVRLGRVDTGIRGQFVDVADELAGSYDVVSMHHYLEHTREPLAELDAAAKVLAPGGLLLIEVPDPEYPMAEVLRTFWPPWAQPQHQHFFTVANLERELAARGFETIQVDTGSAHLPDDWMLTVLYVLQRLAPEPWAPWAPDRSLAAQARRLVGLAVAAPFVAVAFVVDRLSVPFLAKRPRSNTFRLLARSTLPVAMSGSADKAESAP